MLITGEKDVTPTDFAEQQNQQSLLWSAPTKWTSWKVMLY